MTKPHYKVLIATPGNNFTSGYLKSLLQTTFFLQKEGIDWAFLNEGGSFIPVVREQIVAGPNFNDYKITKPYNEDFTYDKIIWIDSDIEWSVDDFFKLYNSEKDIISGCYLMEDRHTPIYTKIKGPMLSEKDLLKKKDIFEIVACGFGFVAMKQGVFENIPRPWFISEKIDNDEKLTLMGEDLSWCMKALKSGFKLWADPSIKVVHRKSFNLIWDSI